MLKKEIGYVVDWSKVDKEDYLLAMEQSYMKGIDHSYYYEGYYVFKTEDLK